MTTKSKQCQFCKGPLLGDDIWHSVSFADLVAVSKADGPYDDIPLKIFDFCSKEHCDEYKKEAPGG